MERNVTQGEPESGPAAAETVVKPAAPATGARKRPPTKGKDEGHVSKALKTAYQRTVDEDIPAEMLDLLRKLD